MGTDAIVVGGGVAGMVTAHRLQRSSADVVLLEKQDRLGGIVETTIEDGFVIEGGPDSFVTSKGSVLQLADELGLEREVISANPESSGSYVWWDGQLHPLPGGLLLMVPSRLGPFLGSSLLSWRGKVVALKDFVLPRSRKRGDESLSSFVQRRLGREVLERIAEPLVAGIHAADPETMSLRASFPRFLDMEAEHRSLILAAGRLESAAGGAAGRSHFSSFRLGMGQLVSALASSLNRVDVRTERAATVIERTGNGYVVGLDDGSRINGSAVVLAVPAPAASRLLGRLSENASAAISGIAQTSSQALTLAYRTDQLPPLRGSGFVVPSKQGSPVRGVSYLSRKWAGRVPDEGFTLLRVFFAAGSDGDSPVDTAREQLRTMIGVTAEPARAWWRKHRQGLHRYTLGHLERIARAERELLHDCPAIALAGAGFSGVGLNECVSSGWKAAEKVVESAAMTRIGP